MQRSILKRKKVSITFNSYALLNSSVGGAVELSIEHAQNGIKQAPFRAGAMPKKFLHHYLKEHSNSQIEGFWLTFMAL